MGSYFKIDDYKKYVIKMRGGKEYLQVVGVVKAAIDYGVLLGTETTITETDTMVRVHVRAKVLNKHLENFADLPIELQVGYYDGIADNPKTGGSGAAQNFPLEDAETSALGRALSKVGFNYETMATADEMQIVEVKRDSGYVAAPPRAASPAVEELRAALKSNGVTTVKDANLKANERYGVIFSQLTDEQAKDWLHELKSTPKKATPF